MIISQATTTLTPAGPWSVTVVRAPSSVDRDRDGDRDRVVLFGFEQ